MLTNGYSAEFLPPYFFRLREKVATIKKGENVINNYLLPEDGLTRGIKISQTFFFEGKIGRLQKELKALMVLRCLISANITSLCFHQS